MVDITWKRLAIIIPFFFFVFLLLYRACILLNNQYNMSQSIFLEVDDVGVVRLGDRVCSKNLLLDALNNRKNSKRRPVFPNGYQGIGYDLEFTPLVLCLDNRNASFNDIIPTLKELSNNLGVADISVCLSNRVSELAPIPLLFGEYTYLFGEFVLFGKEGIIVESGEEFIETSTAQMLYEVDFNQLTPESEKNKNLLLLRIKPNVLIGEYIEKCKKLHDFNVKWVVRIPQRAE